MANQPDAAHQAAAASAKPTVLEQSGGKKRSRRWRWLRRGLLTLVLLVGLGGLIGWGILRASLPTLSGTVTLAGLQGTVSIRRNAQGVPEIQAQHHDDLMFGLGFVHAQDRYFLMDLQRRVAAGELAELFGAGAVPLDRKHRQHRFRSRAQQFLLALSDAELDSLNAYTNGVNAGLHHLATAPFEYWVLQTKPAAWQAEDSLLVLLTMYILLEGNGADRERSLLTFRHVFADQPDWLAFLDSPAHEWQSLLVGEPMPKPPHPVELLLPKPVQQHPSSPTALVPKTALAPDELRATLEALDPPVVGSNNWAVAGSHTNHGGAILANDMHLPLRIPNIMYRAAWKWTCTATGPTTTLAPEATAVYCCGVTLPGGPALIAGSNGHVAWGFTNTEADWMDLILVQPDPESPRTRYKTPAGYEPFTQRTEIIHVKGAAPVELEVLETRWGPVVEEKDGVPYLALRWVAYDELGVNLKIGQLAYCLTLEQLLATANEVGAPHQNCVAADKAGNIAWTIMGRLPRRVGLDGQVPMDWSVPDIGWQGYWPPSRTPRLVNPPSGRLWSANARVWQDQDPSILGNGHYDPGARQRQIRDRLLALPQCTEADMLAIQRDDRAFFLDRWQKLALQVLNSETAQDWRPENSVLQSLPIPANSRGNWDVADLLSQIRQLVEQWEGRPTPESRSFVFLASFRRAVIETVIRQITEPCYQVDPQFDFSNLQGVDELAWRALHTPEEAGSEQQVQRVWEAVLLETVVLTWFRACLDPKTGQPRRWRDVQQIRIQHPFTSQSPWLAQGLGWWLDMPTTYLPGCWAHLPCIQTATHGPCERFAVSPGKERSGYMHLPGGQSGHPLSPFYRAGHDDWAEARFSPFLPFPNQESPTYELELRPKPNGGVVQK